MTAMCLMTLVILSGTKYAYHEQQQKKVLKLTFDELHCAHATYLK
jgi:hypothetical protein